MSGNDELTRSELAPSTSWRNRDYDPRLAASFVDLAGAVREFQNLLAGATPPSELSADLANRVRAMALELAQFQVPERNAMFGHVDVPGRAQTLSPVFASTRWDRDGVAGVVRFGRFYLGGNGAVHGGAIPLIFDEVLGRLANTDRRPSRTAYLHVNYRAVTPLDTDLSIEAHFEREEGRKRFLVATLKAGDVVLADAEGLFVQLNPGQP